LDAPSVGLAWPVIAWFAAGALVLAGAVAVDARERGQPAPLWFVVALLFPAFGALAYLVLRPPPLTEAVPVERRGGDAPAGVVVAPRAEAAADYGRPSPSPQESASPAAARPAAQPAGGTVEWRRGVGVLSGPPTGESLGISPPSHAPVRRRSPVPPWLLGAGLGVVLLVIAGAFGLTRVGLPGAAVQATSTPVATPVPAAAPSPATEAAAEPAAESSSEPTYYTVEPGDSLGSIARDYDTTIDALMQANGIEDADTLIVGQRLIVPR